MKTKTANKNPCRNDVSESEQRLDLNDLQSRWAAAMRGYVSFLVQQANQKPELAATLTVLELANLFALLEHSQQTDDAAATIDLTTKLYSLLQNLGKPRLLAKIWQVRDTAVERLGASWSHAHFEAQRTHTEQLLKDGQVTAAYSAATALLQQARAAGTQAYDVANYDLAMACFILGRVFRVTGKAAPALPFLAEAKQGFDAIAVVQDSKSAARMASVCLTEQGDCLNDLGRLDEAAAAYDERIRQCEEQGDERGVAINKFQLGLVYLSQRLYSQALAAYEQARDQFAKLQELVGVATAWHQIGRAHHDAGQLEAAEAAYQEAYRLNVQLADPFRQANTLGELGNLYDDALNRPEQAAHFYRQAADIYQQLGNKAGEGRAMNNFAYTLLKLRRYDEAHDAIQQTITCYAEFSHAVKPWTAWQILANIETDCGNLEAASTAKRQAIAAYLAYRCDGGENHTTAGRSAHAVHQSLSTEGTAATIAELEEALADPKSQPFHTYLNTLIAVLNGNHDPSIADADDLDYSMAAEILLLIDTVQAGGQA